MVEARKNLKEFGSLNIDAVIAQARENKRLKHIEDAKDHGVDMAAENKRMTQARNLFEMVADRMGYNVDEINGDQAAEIAQEVVYIQEFGGFEDSDAGNRKAAEALLTKLGGDPNRKRDSE